MKSIRVCGSEVLLKESLEDDFGQYLVRALPERCKVFVLTDSNVAPLYLSGLKSLLMALGFKVESFVVAPGEEGKTLWTAKKIYEFLSSRFASRTDAILALGGGVVTDLAGFVASTYLRGMKLINAPTSLLAMIDASIGGKNALNCAGLKNSVGTFYFPSLVLIDPDFLKSLSSEQFACGIAEAIKCGAIMDEKLFEILEKETKIEDKTDQIILKSILVKKQLVEQDKFDHAERMKLNFGHTIGHAAEVLSSYKGISHGQAVAVGMNMVTRISESLGLTEKGTSQRLASVCRKYSLPEKTDFSSRELAETILHDKKILGDVLNLVLLKSIGTAFLHTLPLEEAAHFIKREGEF